MPDKVVLPLSGPVFDRAVLLTREAVTGMLHADGPSALWALEPVLTEMANDRVLGGVTAMLLVSVAARAALSSSALELDADAEVVEVAGPVLDGAVSLVEDLLAEIVESALRRP